MRKAVSAAFRKGINNSKNAATFTHADLTPKMTYRALEQRIVFDAAMAATADQTLAAPADTSAETDAPASDANPLNTHVEVATLLPSGSLNSVDATVGSAQPAASTSGGVLVFVDSSIGNLSALLANVPATAEIILLDASKDGLSQIAGHAASHDNLSAIHIVSHGSAGHLTLGNTSYDAATLASHSAELASIGAALSASGDILIYGCDIGAGAAGQEFVAALADATGADIAASSDGTGTVALGGDWDLEIRNGLIEAGLIDAPEWNGLLAPLQIQVSGDPVKLSGVGGAADPFNSVGNTALWTNAGTIGGTSIDIRAAVISTTTFNSGVFARPYVDFITSNFEDMQVIVWNGSATIKWEIFASGTNQTVYAVGSPNFSIRDLDGLDAQNLALPAVELEAVIPSLNGLTSYTLEGNPTAPNTLNAGIVGSNLVVAGTINRNAETNSMVSFGWSEVSNWTVTYVGNTAFVNPDGSISARFYYHDGDGDFTFVNPATTSMLSIDLDANDSTLAGLGYQTTFTENGSAVAVVDADVVIAQHLALGTTIHEGTVRLINAQAGDELLINGSNALSGTVSAGGATFAYTVNTSGGQIEVTFTGAATVAQYQAALQAITFHNTLEAPSTTDRQIEVFVTNTLFGTSSNQALSTIHVAAVNDAPTDASETNTVTEDITLSVPAATGLLAGATDADGDLLTISDFTIQGVSGPHAANSSINIPGVGDIQINADGSYSFAPALNYNGPVPAVTYTVTDGNGGTDTSTLQLSIAPVSDFITATAPAAVSTPEDVQIVFSTANGNAIVLADPDASGSAVIRLAVPAGAGALHLATTAGLLTVSGDGSNEVIITGPVAAITAALDGLRFVPRADWSGPLLLDLSITTTRPADVGFVNPGFELPDYADINSFRQVHESLVPGWETTATDGLIETWDSGFNGGGGPAIPAFEGDQFVELNATQASTLYQTFTPTTAGGDLSLTFAHRGRVGVDTMNVTAIDLGADGVEGGGDDTVLFNQNYTDGNTSWQQYQADLGTASGNAILLKFTAVSSAGGITTGNFLDAINIYDSSLSATTGISLTVTPVADAVDDTVATDEDTAITFNVMTGANGAEADNFESPAASVTAITQPANGTVSFASDGTLTYTPSHHFHGSDTFTYTVTSGGVTETATVVVTVAPVNDAPVDLGETNTVIEDVPLNVPAATGLLAGAADPDGDTLTITEFTIDGVSGPHAAGNSVTIPGVGVIEIAANGAYSFVPDANYNGAIPSVTYTIADGNGGTDTSTLQLTMAAVNDAPTGIVSDLSTYDGATISIDTGINFTDADGDDLTFTIVGLPAGLTFDPGTGVISGTIAAGASQGGTGGVYTVSVVVDDGTETVTRNFALTVQNIPPAAVDDAATINEDDASVTGNVISDTLTGDLDGAPDSDPLTVAAAHQSGTAITLGVPFTTAGGGILTLNADGSYTFAPGTAYNGLDAGETATEAISYTVSDGNGGQASASLIIVVTGANDAPVVIHPLNPGTPSNPIAATDPLTIIPGVLTSDGATPAPANVGAYLVDPDGEPLTFTATGLPPGMVIDPATGIITGTLPADASQSGPYTAIITATDPDGASVQTAVIYTVINLPPVANDDAASLSEVDASVTGNVISDPLTGDLDGAPDSDPLTVAVADQSGTAITLGVPFTTAGGGILTLNADGSYTFEPGTAYNGLDAGETATEAINYTVSDGNGGHASASLIIVVTGTNDTPIVIDPLNPGTPSNPIAATDPLNIIPDVLTSDGTGFAPINVAAYIVDPDGEPLTYALMPDAPAWLTFDPDTGYISGTPPSDASQLSNIGTPGQYLVTIIATDPDGTSVETTVTLTIVNLSPVAEADTNTVSEDGVGVSGNILDNDADAMPDSDLLTVQSSMQGAIPITLGTPFTTAGGGILTFNADGSYTFEPGTAYNGLDSGEIATETISYTVSDGNGGTATATLVLSIQGANDAPVVIDPLNPGTPSNPIAATDPLTIIPHSNATDGTALTLVNVAAFVVDPDGEPLTYALSPDAPAWLSIDPDTGLITGTPPFDASQVTNTGTPGEYLVTIIATDPDGTSVETTVTLTIDNAPPVAVDDVASVDRGLPTVIQVLANDVDGGSDGDDLKVIAAVASTGTVVINPDGTLTYTPPWGYEGTAIIEYRLSDNQGGQAAAKVTLTITADPMSALPQASENSLPPLLDLKPRPVTAEGAVLKAVNAVELLDGMPLAEGETSSDDTGSLQNPAFAVFKSNPALSSNGDVHGLSSFSLRFSNTGAVEQKVLIENFVRGQTMILNLGMDGVSKGQSIEWKLQTLDGHPMPDWLAFVGKSSVYGQRPADVETIDLRVIGILPDGTIVTHEFRLQAITGEMQPLSIGKSGLLAPKTFLEQLKLDAMINSESLHGLANLLKRKAG